MDFDAPPRASDFEAFRRQWRDNISHFSRDSRPNDDQTSVESMSTLRQMSVISSDTMRSMSVPSIPSLPDDDVLMQDQNCEDSPKKFIVGVDYGTTFTSVSYYVCSTTEEYPQVFPGDVKSIINWPDDSVDGQRKQVPSEIWYPKEPIARQILVDREEPGYGAEDIYTADDHISANAARAHNSQEVGCEEDDDQGIDNDDSTELLWGYTVSYQEYLGNTNRNRRRIAKRAKLMLLGTKYTKRDRNTLQPVLKRLRTQKIIQNNQDVITDFLTKVFQHTKEQLTLLEGYTTACPVEFVLTVPTIWSPKSSRVMQAAMESAILLSGFGTLQNGGVNNLFIVPEPEAAATYLLAASNDMLVCILSVSIERDADVSFTARGDFHSLRLWWRYSRLRHIQCSPEFTIKTKTGRGGTRRSVCSLLILSIRMFY